MGKFNKLKENNYILTLSEWVNMNIPVSTYVYIYVYYIYIVGNQYNIYSGESFLSRINLLLVTPLSWCQSCFDRWVMDDGLACWPEQWVTKRCLRFWGLWFETGIHFMKQWIRNWYLPCFLCMDTCYCISSIENNIYIYHIWCICGSEDVYVWVIKCVRDYKYEFQNICEWLCMCAWVVKYTWLSWCIPLSLDVEVSLVSVMSEIICHPPYTSMHVAGHNTPQLSTGIPKMVFICNPEDYGK